MIQDLIQEIHGIINDKDSGINANISEKLNGKIAKLVDTLESDFSQAVHEAVRQRLGPEVVAGAPSTAQQQAAAAQQAASGTPEPAAPAPEPPPPPPPTA